VAATRSANTCSRTLRFGLKQGFGRLIRSSTDRGVVVIADPRIVTKNYGRAMLAGLPPARQVFGKWTDLSECRLAVLSPIRRCRSPPPRHPRRPSPIAHRPSPFALSPVAVAHRPSPIAHRPSPSGVGHTLFPTLFNKRGTAIQGLNYPGSFAYRLVAGPPPPHETQQNRLRRPQLPRTCQGARQRGPAEPLHLSQAAVERDRRRRPDRSATAVETREHEGEIGVVIDRPLRTRPRTRRVRRSIALCRSTTSPPATFNARTRNGPAPRVSTRFARLASRLRADRSGGSYSGDPCQRRRAQRGYGF
jgi:hypothetical protein